MNPYYNLQGEDLKRNWSFIQCDDATFWIQLCVDVTWKDKNTFNFLIWLDRENWTGFNIHRTGMDKSGLYPVLDEDKHIFKLCNGCGGCDGFNQIMVTNYWILFYFWHFIV